MWIIFDESILTAIGPYGNIEEARKAVKQAQEYGAYEDELKIRQVVDESDWLDDYKAYAADDGEY